MKVYNNRFNNIFTGIHYVYIYYDPDTDIPFYVGKGKNDRVYFHLKEKVYSGKHINYGKLNKIKNIKDKGKLPKIQFACGNKSESEAYSMEQFLIDTIGTIKKKTGPLTNLVTEGCKRLYDTENAKEIYKKISKSRKEGFKTGKITSVLIGKNHKGKNNPRYGDHRNYEQIYGKDRAEEKRKVCKINSIGKNNPNAKNWILIDPNGTKYTFLGNCKQFCKDYNLSMETLKRNIGNKIHFKDIIHVNYPNTEGWTLYENTKK